MIEHESRPALDMSWQDGAPCVGLPASMFYPAGVDKPPPEIINMCRTQCPLQFRCLRHGVEHEVFGWWGGYGPKDLVAMRAIRETVGAR